MAAMAAIAAMTAMTAMTACTSYFDVIARTCGTATTCGEERGAEVAGGIRDDVTEIGCGGDGVTEMAMYVRA